MYAPEEWFSANYELLCVHKYRILPEENSILWQLELALASEDSYFLYKMSPYIWKCWTGRSGLFDQKPRTTIKRMELSREKFLAYVTKDDYMSPDQLIAFVGFFYKAKEHEYIRRIWNYLKDHNFTYDNITGETNYKRLMQPAALCFIAVCYGWKWVTPILSAICITSCLRPKRETSGKLKAWAMMKVLNMKKTYWVCTKLVKDWNIVSGIYFNYSGHPLKEIDPTY